MPGAAPAKSVPGCPSRRTTPTSSIVDVAAVRSATPGTKARRRGAARTMARPKPRSQGSRELMHEMSIYATQARPKILLQEYFRRLVLAQPKDPIKFLQNEIRDNPVVPDPFPDDIDERSIAEQEKRLDVRSLATKKACLKTVFDRFVKDDKCKLASMLIVFEEDPTILLEACPKHARDLPLALEKVSVEGGLFDWKTFCDAGLLCLSQPGASPGSADEA